ncbi:hemolysin family protein [Terrilactibacillus laevilacticus]|uniref:Hemolysin family protein n=1 Tax=Terrilactibacillus laevilacticus TaxID=1380157 RepID=A0ABW5PNN1_9BACI|nr:hemolysin family protein [Terrilactibacillus laevilacticus]
MDLTKILIIFILIALTAFFVAAEFAIVKVRRSKIEQLVAEGNKRALAAQKVITHLDEYLSACQLGITVTAMGLGWLGEPTIERLLHPLFNLLNFNGSVSSILSFGVAFFIMTYLHVVVGELAPKTLAIQQAEKVTLLFSTPLIWFYKIMFPFIRLLNGSSRMLTKFFGLKQASEHEKAHSEEELRLLLSESYERGEINQAEFKYVNNIFEFDDRVAKEIMVPRTEIVTVSDDDTIEDLLKIVKSEQYTRYPVTSNNNKDEIIGLINVKEVLTDFAYEQRLINRAINSYLKPVIQVIETMPIHDLLIKMQKQRIQMAILMDEYGGTSGLVTVEDILEEIVGEIQDEFDANEVTMIQKINSEHYLLDSKVLIDEVNELLGTNIDSSDMDTIGGWILTENYDIQVGESIQIDAFNFKIIAREEHHIKRIEVSKVHEHAESKINK